MDDKTELIQRCIDEKLKYQIESEAARTWAASATANGNFSRWIKILETGTFNLIERVTIKAALHKHRREATKKIICSTLIDGGYTSEEEADRQRKYEEDNVDYPDDPEIEKYNADLAAHLKGYPGYEDEPIHPHAEYEFDASRDVNEILKDWNKCK